MWQLVTNRLIRIYTVSSSIITFLLNPCLQQWVDSEKDEAISEIQG